MTLDLRELDTEEGTKVLFAGLMDRAEIYYYWSEIEKSLDSFPRLWETMTKEWLLAEALAGKVQFWCFGTRGESIDVFLMTSIETMVSGAKELHVFFGVGDGVQDKYWDLMQETLERVRVTLGLDAIVIKTVRRGLERVLEKNGFTLRTVELVKRFGKERLH